MRTAITILNLLLRKFRLLKGDHTEEIFYSPWRRSLRPLYGILHATFTFTMGAMLFERLSAWGTKQAASQLRAVGSHRATFSVLASGV